MLKIVTLLNDFTVFTVTFDQLNQWFPNWGAELCQGGRGKAEG